MMLTLLVSELPHALDIANDEQTKQWGCGQEGWWTDRDWAEGQGAAFLRGSTHRPPEVNELLPHLGHEGFLGHQGPVQALVELDQLAVHLRHLEHKHQT